MKKIFLALAIIIGLTATAVARDLIERTDKSLPEAAKLTLSQNFKAKVALVKIDKKVGYIEEYEVILNDGTEVSFDARGNWDSIETPLNKSVPSKLVPAAITAYVKSNFEDATIVSIDKEGRGYEVELNNGVDLKFDQNGNFKRFD